MNLPEKVINRLTLYHYIIDNYDKAGKPYIISSYLAKLLNIDNSQVRKDFKFLNTKLGKCRVGYDVKELKKSIEETLGFKQTKKAFIVGAGNLGTALVKYNHFKTYGLKILAMFDNDPIKTDMILNDVEVLHISKLPELAEKTKAEIAILTVPCEAAQSCAELLANSGIKYIWNFTPCVLNLPEDIKVWNENLIGNFLQFTKDLDTNCK